MRIVTTILGVLVASALAAAAWAGFTHYTLMENFIMPVIVGVFVGGGALIGAWFRGNLFAGVLAAVFAVVSLVAGRWGHFELLALSYYNEHELAVSGLADVIMDDAALAGKPIAFTPTNDTFSLKEEYSKAVWRQALARWDALSADRQDEIRRYWRAADEEWLTVWVAGIIAGSRDSLGEALHWPDGYWFDNAWRSAHFPPDVWEAAQQQLDAMSEQERAQYRVRVINEAEAYQVWEMDMVRRESVVFNFLSAIGPAELIYVLCAAGPAFAIGWLVRFRRDPRTDPMQAYLSQFQQPL